MNLWSWKWVKTQIIKYISIIRSILNELNSLNWYWNISMRTELSVLKCYSPFSFFEKENICHWELIEYEDNISEWVDNILELGLMRWTLIVIISSSDNFDYFNLLSRLQWFAPLFTFENNVSLCYWISLVIIIDDSNYTGIDFVLLRVL
jgi:hypothetical protein